MLPTFTKPLILYSIEEVLEAVMNNIAFVTGCNKRAIDGHCDITYERENKISGADKESQLDGASPS